MFQHKHVNPKLRTLVSSHPYASLSAGTLPTSWGNPEAFPELQVLVLLGNPLAGPVPDAWGNPGAFLRLKYLALSYTYISGTLPDSWALVGRFPNLEVLVMSNNSMTGSIPVSWGSPTAFPSLSVLSLGNNALQGGLPAFHIQHLQLLDFSHNNLSEGLDTFCTINADLVSVQLADNVLTGSLPSTGALDTIRLDLSHNQLQGTVPLTWLKADGLLANVTVLDVGPAWTQSLKSNSWRQQLCLNQELYDVDVTK